MTEKTGSIVKWSLSDGVILAEEGTEARAPNCKSIYFRPSYPYAPSLVVGKEVFYSKDEAVKAANEMRKKRIESLKRQIAKLESHSFAVEEK